MPITVLPVTCDFVAEVYGADLSQPLPPTTGRL